MKVEHLMTSNPHCCSVHDSINVAAQLMWERDCGIIPVVDDDARVVGVVTDRDVAMAAYTQGRPLHDIPVSVAMAHQVLVCQGGDDVAVAEKTMREGRVRRLPVVDMERHLVGLLSLDDLARVAVNGKHAGTPRPADVTETFAAICQRPGAASHAGAALSH